MTFYVLYCTVPVQELWRYFYLSSEIKTGTKKWSAVTMKVYFLEKNKESWTGCMGCIILRITPRPHQTVSFFILYVISNFWGIK